MLVDDKLSPPLWIQTKQTNTLSLLHGNVLICVTMQGLCICDSRRRHYLREMQFWSFVQRAPTWQVRLLCLSLCLFGSHQVYTRGSSWKMRGAPRLCVQVLCVVGPEMCVSFGLRCLSWFKSLSHALLPMSINGKGRRSFCFKEKRKRSL